MTRLPLASEGGLHILGGANKGGGAALLQQLSEVDELFSCSAPPAPHFKAQSTSR